MYFSSSILDFQQNALWWRYVAVVAIMNKKIFYFVLFLLVCCVSGYFLVNLNSVVNTLIYFLSILVASYLLNKAFPIHFKKEETDEEN